MAESATRLALETLGSSASSYIAYRTMEGWNIMHTCKMLFFTIHRYEEVVPAAHFSRLVRTGNTAGKANKCFHVDPLEMCAEQVYGGSVCCGWRSIIAG